MAKTINDYADNLLQEINLCVSDALKSAPCLKGAVVSNVNPNGTVDVYFPPKTDIIFTNILNQTPFTLQVGDAVELLLKGGNYSNCWVVAKHQATFSTENDVIVLRDSINETFKDMQEKYDDLEARVSALEQS